MKTLRRRIVATASLALTTGLLLVPLTNDGAVAAEPSEFTIGAPAGSNAKKVVQKKTWTGVLPATGTADPTACVEGVNCDTATLHLTIPENFWQNNTGELVVGVTVASGDIDLYIYDADGNQVGSSASTGGNETAPLGQLPPGDYSIQTVSFTAVPGSSYSGFATLTSQKIATGMKLPENRESLMKELTVKYPLRVIFVGKTPTKAEVAELKEWIPDQYQPTVANVAGAPNNDSIAGQEGLLNWNRGRYAEGVDPYFLGARYEYDVQIYAATEKYSKRLFRRAKNRTAPDQTFKDNTQTAQLVKYDESYGKYRIAAKGGDPSFQVADPSVVDMVDAYAMEDWIWKSRVKRRWKCAFVRVETGKCKGARILQNTAGGYHDPYYDKNGLNLDKMPQGVNKGSTFFFFDTFTPEYAADYFRPDAYHTWTTDRVLGHKIIQKPLEEGGGWRITDPDTKDWAGADFARTWGGRYRFHFLDLGAAPNNYESAAWLGRGVDAMSNDYPMGDPPVWQYDADPQWQDPSCGGGTPEYVGDPTPCALLPRAGRSVAYGLFFRMTAGYLYRPIPQGDVYWLATTNFTDFYSRPQWVNGAPVGAPYGTWWTDPTKLYLIDDIKKKTHEDTLRWLSSAMPYVRWVGRKNEVIPIYNQKTGKKSGTLDVSPKYADLPAPEFKITSGALGAEIVPEPLYGGQHEIMTTADGTRIDLTEFQNIIEKAKAYGVTGATYDDSVNTDIVRDHIDANRKGLADIVPGLGTVPSVNMVFEKAYTWALPVIVGGIAIDGPDGNAWGVLNNVNDRVKACSSHAPMYNPATSSEGDKVSLAPCIPTQEPGSGFSYTIEHEAAHNLGLSHPHDGSYGVQRCPEGEINEGEWKCYFSGLGWLMDIAAAPTTYAMDYRPYEVEDQDQLQRGHAVEYLLSGQEALQDMLLAQSAKGLTKPNAKFKKRYAAYKVHKKLAVKLFKKGDYLHAEYAARNAALAARGVKQTAKNTIAPRLVQAGQIFYWKINPQSAKKITYKRKKRKP